MGLYLQIIGTLILLSYGLGTLLYSFTNKGDRPLSLLGLDMMVLGFTIFIFMLGTLLINL